MNDLLESASSALQFAAALDGRPTAPTRKYWLELAAALRASAPNPTPQPLWIVLTPFDVVAVDGNTPAARWVVAPRPRGTFLHLVADLGRQCADGPMLVVPSPNSARNQLVDAARWLDGNGLRTFARELREGATVHRDGRITWASARPLRGWRIAV